MFEVEKGNISFYVFFIWLSSSYIFYLLFRYFEFNTLCMNSYIFFHVPAVEHNGIISLALVKSWPRFSQFLYGESFFEGAFFYFHTPLVISSAALWRTWVKNIQTLGFNSIIMVDYSKIQKTPEKEVKNAPSKLFQAVVWFSHGKSPFKCGTDRGR